MTQNIEPSNRTARKAALITGIGLLLMAIIAPFANFYVLPSLIVTDDAKATTNQILANPELFRLGIVAFMLVAVLDVIVAWGLYVFLEPIHKNLAILVAWFRVVYSAVFALALNPLLGVLQLLEKHTYLQALEPTQIQAQVMLSISAFQSGWNLGLILFGCHLLVMGYLVLTSNLIPKWLGVLLEIAGLGYLIDGFGKLFSAAYTISISEFTFIGEPVLIFWLLWYFIIGWKAKISTPTLSSSVSRD